MFSTSSIHLRNHPFPFLLYGEWVLLALALIGELSPRALHRANGLPLGVLCIILVFGSLGLWLPTRSAVLKCLHLGGQFGLVLLATRLSSTDLRLLPLLYIVLVLRSCLLLSLGGRLVVTFTAYGFFLILMQNRLRSLDFEVTRRLGRRLLPYLIGIRLNLAIMFGLLLMFLLLLMHALLLERSRQEELRQAHEKLQASTARLEKLAMAQERTRIAREIHDSVGHSLTGINIQLEGALKFWEGNPEQAKQFVNQAKTLGSTALQDVRQAVAALREKPLAEADLSQRLMPLLQQFEQTTGIKADIEIAAPPVSAALSLTIYRILQEALTNIARHAQAQQVNVAIATTSSHQLVVTIADDGAGFDPQDNLTGFGLKGIRERAVGEGGQFELNSAPGQGCWLKICLPVPPETP